MRRLVLALLPLLGLACAGPPPPLPASALAPVRPAHRGEVMVASNAACEACHVEIAAEWRASLHRTAWTEPAFQRAYEREPLAFCRGCHAPEAPPAAAPPAALGELGVGCVTCHVDGASILAATTRVSRGPAPHPVVRDGRLDGAVACAGCHEFAFPPRGAPLGEPSPMQSTVSEHRASPAAARGCASCHMPASGGRRSHRFAASRDEALVRAAVHVEARREGRARVEVRLASQVMGHAFPTGDLFRRVEILVEAVGPGETLAASATRYLARHFPLERLSPGGPRARVFGPDDRLRHEPVTIVLDLGERATGLPLRWRVAYQRVAHPRAGEATSAIDGEVVLASGELPAFPAYASPPNLGGSPP